MNSSVYMTRSQEVSFDRFMQIVASHSACSAKDNKDPNAWPDESRQALRSVYDAIYKKRGVVTVGNAAITGQTMLAQNAESEW
ncbi:MAG: hypothetical protein U9Q12_02190 [Patescibacteria group bacterium]|nr:hypothetical protein [Patescibacteria group bacterium]